MGNLRELRLPFLESKGDVAIQCLTRPRITDASDRDRQAQLTADLDLDIPDMPRPIEPPGQEPDIARRRDGEQQKRKRGQDLAVRSSEGEHPCLSCRLSFVTCHLS